MAVTSPSSIIKNINPKVRLDSRRLKELITHRRDIQNQLARIAGKIKIKCKTRRRREAKGREGGERGSVDERVRGSYKRPGETYHQDGQDENQRQDQNQGRNRNLRDRNLSQLNPSRRANVTQDLQLAIATRTPTTPTPTTIAVVVPPTTTAPRGINIPKSQPKTKESQVLYYLVLLLSSKRRLRGCLVDVKRSIEEEKRVKREMEEMIRVRRVR